MIAIDRLSKRFDGLLALNEVSVKLGEDDRVAIIGPNGSGKTTFLNLISGVERPSSGTVRLHDGPVSYEQGDVHWRIARTFQSPRLFECLNVQQNILAGRAAASRGKVLGDWVATLRSPWRSRSGEVADVLRTAGLEAWSERTVPELSYGQRKLVELARALAGNPRILLLDEPTAGLNRTEARVVLALLQEILARHRICLVVVEHDFGFVEALCNRVLVLKQGNLIFDGSPAAAKTDERVVESYLGSL